MGIKVMVAMSGGVDSSVAALLLRQEGYELCGATLKLFDGQEMGMEDAESSCCSLSDVLDARDVAARMGFHHYVFNFSGQFKEDVIQRFADSYERGETPNPCIDCNRFIKFPQMIKRAMLMGQDYIATGHYARVERDENTGQWLLKKGRDASKDQSYVLYAMTQEELAHTLFPLGGLTKAEVRELAQRHHFVNAKKPDSQDICFVSGDYAVFLREVMGVDSPQGELLDAEGNVLGTHKGIIHYTVGQRKGLPVQFGKPQYVIGKNAAAATVTVGDEPLLMRKAFSVRELNWISIPGLEAPMEAGVKVRYSQREAPATLYPREDGTVLVELAQPQRAVTAGQAAVFYNGDVVVGGGVVQDIY